MYPYCKSIVLALLFTVTCISFVYADTFTVISNADNGSGTLRDAITKANANGTSVTDYIQFNLPGTTLADRTIALTSNLPDLSGNLVIDGTTQPGAKLGASDARVILTSQQFLTSYFYFFRIMDAARVEFYGLYITCYNFNIAGSYGIYMQKAKDIKIGAPGKGNVISGLFSGITQETELAENITIQSNLIGTEPDGVSFLPNSLSIELGRVKNLLIGGSNTNEGNVVLCQLALISVGAEDGPAQISFNKLGTDISGTKTYDRSSAISISGQASVRITDNLMQETGMVLFLLDHKFYIQRNKIGTDISGNSLLNNNIISTGINVNDCKEGLIGGSVADGNIIAGCIGNAITVGETYGVTVSNNILFCNGGGIGLTWYATQIGRPAPTVTITKCTATGVEGTATPLSKVDVYESDDCIRYTFWTCEGKTYLGSVMADAAGNWAFNTSSTKGLIATATDSQGATSEFSYGYMDGSTMKVTHASCGKNGSITGLKVIRGMYPHWEDLSGNIVSNDTSLLNAAPGSYTFVLSGAGCNSNACKYYYGAYDIKELSPVINEAGVYISNASCGQKNGYISGLAITGQYLRKTWKNAAGIIVGTEDYLDAAGPGKYTFEIQDTVNGCTVTAGPYEIINLQGPTLNVSQVRITPSTCAAANGSIQGLTVAGTGTIIYTWVDANGAIQGSQPDLPAVKAGKYVLTFSDNSGCAAADSDTFTVSDIGSITVDTSQMVVTPTGCAGNTGAISGIITAGASTFRWLNTTGQTAGTSVDLAGVAADKYRLLLSNTNGCTASTDYITVPKVAPPAVMVEHIMMRPPVCGEANGQITDIQLSGPLPVSYKWMREDGSLAGTDKSISGLPPGRFTLNVTDANGCEQTATTVILTQPPLPLIKDDNIHVMDDQCNTGAGSISNLVAEGAAPFTYQWYNNAIVNSTSLLLQNIKAGVYYIIATDANGCTVQSNSYTVNNTILSLAAPAVADITIVKGMDAPLQVSNKATGTYRLYTAAMPGNALYTSATGDFNITGLQVTTSFLVEHQLGDCNSALTKVTVTVIDKTEVYVPTAFTPNGDGVNDLFRLKAFGLASLDYFNVYNRWGQKVFSTRDIQGAWDGTLKGHLLPNGAYLWSIKGKDIRGTTVVKQGSITLLR